MLGIDTLLENSLNRRVPVHVRTDFAFARAQPTSIAATLKLYIIHDVTAPGSVVDGVPGCRADR